MIGMRPGDTATAHSLAGKCPVKGAPPCPRKISPKPKPKHGAIWIMRGCNMGVMDQQMGRGVMPHPKACIKAMPQAPRGTAGVVDHFMRIGVCDLSCK